MAFHRNLTAADGIHVTQSYEYADQAARLAASGFVPADVGKIAHQASDSTFWILSADSPITWLPIGSSSFVNPMTDRGDVIFGGVGGTATRLAGVNGGYLRSRGNAADPTFVRTLDVAAIIASDTIGAAPDASAKVQIDSTTQGFMLPRMTIAQRDAIVSPGLGLMVYVPLSKRVFFFDGDTWRKVVTDISKVVTVAADGSGDFTSIIDALDSITGATDNNRYVVEVGPGVYAENIDMRDYIQIRGFGWDTLIQGQVQCTALTYTQLADCRVESTNMPCLTVNANVGGEVDITDCFMFANWNDLAAPSEIRRAVECTQGILYVYKESEVTLAVTDTTNVAPTTIQACFLLTGSGEVYSENYGTYCYIDTDNPGNLLAMCYSENTNAATQAVFRLGDFEFNGSAANHENPARAICHRGAAGSTGVNTVRVLVTLEGPGTASFIIGDVQDSQATSSRANSANCQFVFFGTVPDANIYLGRATTSYDEVQISRALVDLTTDVQPLRDTTGGSAGLFRYIATNNFGTSWASGLYNGAEVGADVTDWGNVSAALGGQAGANSGYVFKSDGAGGGAMVKNTQVIRHRLTVGQAGSDADYTSIATAIGYAISQGAANTGDMWEIVVYPGTYTEPPMTLVPDINLTCGTVNRITEVYIVASNPNEDLFTVLGGVIAGPVLQGVTNPSKCLVRCATTYSLCVFHGLSVNTCSNGIIGSNGANLVLTNFSANLSGPGQSIGTAITVSGANTYLGMVGGFLSAPAVLLPYYSSNPVQTGVAIRDAAKAYLVGVAFKLAYKDNTADGLFADGGSVTTVVGCEFTGCANASHIGSSGSNTQIVVQGATFFDNVLNGKSESSTGAFFVSVAVDTSALDLVAGTLLSGVVQYLNERRTALIGEVFYQFSTGKTVDLHEYFHEWSSTGLAYGGEVSDGGGLTVDVAAGEGWSWRPAPDHDLAFVEWAASTGLALTASATNYVHYDPAIPGLNSTTAPPGDAEILLATVVTDGSGIRFLHQTRNVIYNPATRLRTYLMETRKFATASGMGAVAGSTSVKFEVSSGSYYVANDKVAYAGTGGDATFSYFYGTNGATEVSGQTSVDTTYYDASGTLTSMTASYWRSDTVVVTSDGRVSVVYGTSEYATETDAEGAPNAPVPTFMGDTGIYVARLLVQQGNGITKFVDARPYPATGSGGGGGGVTVHNALAGLDADDHTQYLLVSGTRSMSGNLSMGGYNITNVGTIDGVDVSAHASRHNPGGLDALAIGTPVAVTVGGSPSAGDSADYTRGNHQHTIAAGTPVTIGTANAEGDTSSVARSNHVHAHGNQTVDTHHALVVAGVSHGFMSSTDKTKLDGLPSSAVPTTRNIGTQNGLQGGGDLSADRTLSPVYGTTANTVCQGNDSRLSDARTPTAHATTHESGGSDIVAHQNLSGAGTNTHAQIDTHLASTSNPHNVTATQVGLGNVTNDAQLKRAAGDFATFTEKTSLVETDIVLIEDSAAANAKKKVQFINLRGSALAAVQARRTTTYTETVSWANITYDSTDVETNGAVLHHDGTNTDRIYVYETGVYLITYQFEVQPTATGKFEGRVRKNDTTVIPGSTQGTITFTNESDIISVTSVVSLAAGDYLCVQSQIATAGTMQANATFAVFRLNGQKGDTGSGSTITVQDEGIPVTNTPHSALNFTGDGVQATDGGGGVCTVNIPGGSLFGSQAVNAANDTQTSVAGTTWTTHLTLNTGSVPAGTYRVGWYYSWSLDNTNNNFEGQVLQDGATQLMYHVQEPKDAAITQRQPVGGFAYVTLTAATHTFVFQFRAGNVASTATIQRSRLEFWRIS